MEAFWIFFIVSLLPINLLDKAESVQLELKTFDEIFGEGWWDKGEAEDLKTPPPIGQNVHHQIDRQNTQIGQIKPNSTDQNPPHTESDHSHKAKNSEERIKGITSNKNIAENEQKRKIMKNEFKQIGKYSTKEWAQIEKEIAEHLNVNCSKLYKWKKEFGLSRKMLNIGKENIKRKDLLDKFDQRKAELKRDRFKNSHNELDKTVAKELGLNFTTIYTWKREFDQTKPTHKYSHSEEKELMKRYYEINDKYPKIKKVEIAKMLKIGKDTLRRWKKQFKQKQLHPNSVDGHVEENAGLNVQEIERIQIRGVFE